MKSSTLIWVGICCAALFFGGGYALHAPKRAQSSAGQKPWNSQAIRSSFAGVQVREVDATHAALDFVYDLENRTASDFEVAPGPGVVVMKRLNSDGSLVSDPNARLLSAAFIPTNNRTRFTVEMTEFFDWPAKQDADADQSFREFLRREVSGLEGFVIFDQSSRYEIELPIDLATSAASVTPPPKSSD